jgi:biotin transport system substrate-specific component
MAATTLTLPRKRPAVLADLIPASILRDIVLVLVGAGFVGALAQVTIHLSFTPVPITGQTLGVLVAGCALGWRRAAASMAVYLLLGYAGLPWFLGHTSGWQGPSMGYIFGFVLAGGACGWLAEHGADRRVWRALPVMLVGEVIVFFVGVLWLALDLHVDAGKAISLGLTPFLAGEAIKTAIAAGLLPAAWRLTGSHGRSH